jgi:L-arabinose isomerase
MEIVNFDLSELAWQSETVQKNLSGWMRVASARADMQGMKIARFRDNVREVAVTEGDKVEVQFRIGYSVKWLMCW